MKKSIAALVLAAATLLTSCSNGAKKASFDAPPALSEKPEEIEALGAFDANGIYNSDYYGFIMNFGEFSDCELRDNREVIENLKTNYDDEGEWADFIKETNASGTLPVLSVVNDKVEIWCYAMYQDPSEFTEGAFEDATLDANKDEFAASALNSASSEGYEGNNVEGDFIDGFAGDSDAFCYCAKVTSDVYSPIWVFNAIAVADYGALGFQVMAYDEASYNKVVAAFSSFAFSKK